MPVQEQVKEQREVGVVELGDKAKDKKTGYTGIVVAKAEWFKEGPRVALGRELTHRWFSEDRIIHA